MSQYDNAHVPSLNPSSDDQSEHGGLHQLGQAIGAEPHLGDADVSDVELTPLKPTHDENKGFMRFMPPLIKEMNRKGVPFSINGGDGEIIIDGFYKNGPMKLEVGDNDDIIALDKRQRRKVMKTYDDLVMLNFTWWRRSTGRTINVNPDRPWLDAFIEKGLVQRKVIYVPKEGLDDTNGDEE